ncbi:hypothetical protein [Zoogloea sp.]|uniref:hypothetical protein n=1 Tax=Zoogloea sp. TaxID=49181 RepID=UPI00262A6B9C|nr:hypothetical protein [uncultured Zoogloea sp.]
MTRTNPRLLLSLILSGMLLGGCERLGIPDFTKSSVNAEADGKAIGGACRHAGRAIEDCYNLNPGAQRAAVFAGWREMNDYMAEKNIAEVEPKVPPPPPVVEEKPAPKPKRSAEKKDKEPVTEDTDKAEQPDDNAAAETPTTRRRRHSAE